MGSVVSDESRASARTIPLSGSKQRLLEKYLRGEVRLGPAAGRVIPRRASPPLAPLSAGQHQIWLHCQLAPELPLYNEPLTVHRHGPLDVSALEWSLGEVLRRHEAWRTTMAVVGGEPVQVVQEAPPITLPVIDLRGRPPAEREAEALRIATEEARRPFDLARGPLLRFSLIRLGDEEHRLYITLHQIIFDGVSMYSVFLPELTALYEARVAGRPSAIPEPEIQYGDFAHWQRQRSSEETPPAHLDYWRRQLADAPTVLELPGDRPRPPIQTFRGEQPTFALPRQLSDRLKALSQREGATLFTTLLTAFNVLLYRYTGQEDMLVGTVATVRNRPELENLLGFFLNTLVLRTRLSEERSFREVLGSVREATLEALSHAEVPIEQVVKSLQPPRDPSRNPLFQVMFVLEPPLPAPRPGWNLTQMDVDVGIARVDLYLEVDERPEGIVGRVRYSTDLFDRETIACLLERFTVLLESIAARPDQRISALPILAPADKSGGRGPREAATLAERSFAAFSRDEVEQSIPERFAKQAQAHAQRIAVRDGDRAWTYETLAGVVERIAGAVRPMVDGGQARIALLLDHDATMIAGILGVLAAGGTYVPLDPGHPAERLSYIVEDSRARAVLTSARHRPLAQALGSHLQVLDADGALKGPPAGGRVRAVPPDHPAYLLYTSGSTGRPKGVLQDHRNVLHFIRAYTNNLHVSPDDRLTLLSSYSVDAAVMDIFAALLTGAMLRPIDVRAAGLIGLRDTLRGEGITVYHSTPTVYRHLIASCAGQELSPNLRLVVLGGEEVRREDVEAYRKHLPRHCLFVNGFGPTESTVSLQHIVDKRTKIERPSVPLGYPVPDTEVLLLSPRGEPGQLYGEIAIRSRHVALGYWKRPELTRTAFLPQDDGSRIYRTGDMGRLLADGTVEFAGRRDSQAKVRGFRVELGEVETAVAEHPSVREAVAAVRKHPAGGGHLVVYWVARAEPVPADGALRQFLQEKLPEYMMPSAFVRLDALPLTPSGKVDRGALPEPRAVGPEDEPASSLPRDALELRLARLWQDVLGVQTVGRRDHFFEIGGDSLLAVRLFAEIENAFGVRMPLATLFKAPTIEQLAAVLRDKGHSAPWSSLVPLQPGGRRPPFFGVHGHSGEILFYRDLCRRLGPDQPFFALQAQGLNGKAHRTIGDMAAHYLAEIRTVQPHGPYLIGGYCLGAFVAFEMARQLRAAGEDVPLLALFVGYSSERGRRRLGRRLMRLGRQLTLHLGRAQSRRYRAELTRVLKRSRDATRSVAMSAQSCVWRLAYGLLGGNADAPSWLLRDVKEMNLQAARSYVPRTYPGRMTVFLSGDPPPGFRLDPEKDLAGLRSREMDVVRVPGGTDTMMREPEVGILAARLEACLGETRGAHAT